MAVIRIPNGWHPRPYQMPAWQYLENGGKRAILICHRRWGKDDLALHWAAVAAHTRPGSYWHMLPEYEQGRKVIWNAVNARTGKRRIDEAFPLETREKTSDQEMLIRFKTGSTWQVVGSDRYDALVGAGVAGIVFSEWALADPAAWAFLGPIVAENGGWGVFITTPRGRNHAHSMLTHGKGQPDWFTQVCPATETDVFTAAQLEEERGSLRSVYGEDQGDMLWRQEYLCSFEGGLLGSYYLRELDRADQEKRIGSVPFDRYAPVFTAWDLGYTDATAIWFGQAIGQRVHWIDYYEANSQGFDHYADILNKKKAEWGAGARYSEHYFPHDIQAHMIGMDRSRVETLRLLGIEPTVVQNHAVDDGINAVRRLFDRMWFDEKRCSRGMDALRQYRREYDDKTKTYRPKPVHDWSSHGADALRCFAAGWVQSPIQNEPIDRHRRALYGRNSGSNSWKVA